jgi:hypothetical protein
MNHISSANITVSLVLLAFGCVPSNIAPATQAAQLEGQQCLGSAAPQNEARVLNDMTVLKVSPLYGHVHTSPNTYEARVNGATIYVQPPQGVPPEQMAQILQCHSVRELLGQIDQTQALNDPFWLPNSWLDIDVKPELGNYAISISASSVHNGLEVLARANSYGAARMATNDVSVR